MKCLLPALPVVAAACGAQKAKDEIYRPSAHCVTVPCGEGRLLYHTLTRELLLVSESEWAQPPTELILRRFLVPEGFDDAAYALQIRHVLTLMQPKKGSFNRFLIFTTLDCNARCAYCYERGCRHISMDPQTARAAAAFIAEHAKGEKIKLRWFGGEPLLNRKAIDLITKELRGSGIEYSTDMISNGYLFDSETVQTARDLWKLQKVQITLDGTEEVYNRTKAYTGAVNNPYERVMRNIALLLYGGVSVQIRMNMNAENAGNLLTLAEELDHRFPDKKNLSVYPALLQSYGAAPEPFRSQQEKAICFDRLQDKLRTLGLSRPVPLPRRPSLNYCMADDDSAVTILPDGKLGKCEHDIGGGFVGDLERGIQDSERCAYWKERFDLPDCKACPLLPCCEKPRHCPGLHETCTELDRRLKLKSLRESILAEYEKEYNHSEACADRKNADAEPC